MMMALFDWTSETQANADTAQPNKTKFASEAAKLFGAFAAAPIRGESEEV